MIMRPPSNIEQLVAAFLSESCHATPSGTALAQLAFFLPAGTMPASEGTMIVHKFTVATAAAAILAASTMATFAQTGSGTGSGSGSGSGTRSTTTAPATATPTTPAPTTAAPAPAPTTAAPAHATTAQKHKQVNCPGNAENSQGKAKKKNPNCH